jgi:hypothetical protein
MLISLALWGDIRIGSLTIWLIIVVTIHKVRGNSEALGRRWGGRGSGEGERWHRGGGERVEQAY